MAKWGPENEFRKIMKFGPISHILAMLEIQVIATLAPNIFSKRPCSGIYFSVRIGQIGPELAKWQSFQNYGFAVLVLKAPTFGDFGPFWVPAFFCLPQACHIFGGI